MRKLASESVVERLREAPVGWGEAGLVSELASESVVERLREAPAERSEAGR